MEYALNKGSAEVVLQERMPIPDSPPPVNGKSKPSATLSTAFPVPSGPLSSNESSEIQACETIIAGEWESFLKVSGELVRIRESILQQEWDAFVKVGEALRRIRDGHLFRQNYASFPEYCLEKWHYKKAHAYRLITAAETVECLSPLGETLPRNEKQARLFHGLKDEHKRLAWQKAKALAGDSEITVKHIKAAVAEYRPPKKDRKPRLIRGAPSKAPCADDWQKAREIIKRTLYLVKQGGNRPENTENMLKLLEEHLNEMEEARREQTSK